MKRDAGGGRDWRLAAAAAVMIGGAGALIGGAETAPTAATAPAGGGLRAEGAGVPAATTTAPASLAWLSSMNEAYAAAQRAHQPIVVLVGAEWCPWCRKLEAQIAVPAAQSALASWTRVRLDIDHDRDAIRRLGIGPIPALRVLTPLGRQVAAQDGYMAADDLIAWLGASGKAALEAGVERVINDQPLDAAAVPALVEALADPDAATREAAIRRLTADATIAAPAVADALAKGRLATRLSALEVLREWRAPVKDMDPWRPETLTAARLKAVQEWAAKPVVAPQVPATLPAAQLADARGEIDKLLAATTESEIQAIRERLERLGPALLPEVYARLKDAATDQARERLTALRYRLVASDALTLLWPAGLERLASVDVKIRHGALDELGERVTAADSRLLLELFSDPDALVRETSLRLLQAVGGPGATETLVGLLADPDPNVRAAVLKQFAETPSDAVAARIAAYAATEKDPDLVAHAARVLRNTKGAASTQALFGLLHHESWRVRAEAVDGLQEALGGYNATPEQKADLYAAMIKLLADPDGFVVSRAMTSLEGAVGALPDIGPVVKAAEAHPELTAQVVKILAANPSPEAVASLVQFCKHPDPTARAAAVRGLCAAAHSAAAPEMRVALGDKDARVRQAAAEALFGEMEVLHPWSPRYGRRNFSESTGVAAVDPESWLAGQRKTPPAWIDALHDSLEKLLSAESTEERMAAALTLTALGHDDKALPVLRDAAKMNDTFYEGAAEALRWLPWERRAALFDYLKTLHADDGNRSKLAWAFAQMPNAGAADRLWGLLDSKDAGITVAAQVASALRPLYFGANYYNVGSLPEAARQHADKAFRDRAGKGGEMQRLVAMALLLSLDPAQTAAAASKVVDDTQAGDELRADALQLRLMALPKGVAEQTAATYVDSASSSVRHMALMYLASGTRSMRYLRGEIYLYVASVDEEPVMSGQIIYPTAPKGLSVEPLRKLLKSGDAQTAAYAGYLLALQNDRSGLDALLKYYRATQTDRADVRRLAYRAIAALNDETLLPDLEAMYQEIRKESDGYLPDFYWTVRSMDGDKVAAFRKTMRTEVGMERLR